MEMPGQAGHDSNGLNKSITKTPTGLLPAGCFVKKVIPGLAGNDNS